MVEVVQDCWDNKFHNASEWTDVEFNAAVIYSFGCQSAHISNEDTKRSRRN
jgi:hypothetical protein